MEKTLFAAAIIGFTVGVVAACSAKRRLHLFFIILLVVSGGTLAGFFIDWLLLH